MPENTVRDASGFFFFFFSVDDVQLNLARDVDMYADSLALLNCWPEPRDLEVQAVFRLETTD